jgi:hypothetical protein
MSFQYFLDTVRLFNWSFSLRTSLCNCSSLADVGTGTGSAAGGLALPPNLGTPGIAADAAGPDDDDDDGNG